VIVSGICLSIIGHSFMRAWCIRSPDEKQMASCFVRTLEKGIRTSSFQTTKAKRGRNRESCLWLRPAADTSENMMPTDDCSAAFSAACPGKVSRGDHSKVIRWVGLERGRILLRDVMASTRCVCWTTQRGTTPRILVLSVTRRHIRRDDLRPLGEGRGSLHSERSIQT
jgi:hypothetical protein